MLSIGSLRTLGRRLSRGWHGQTAGGEFTAPDWDTYAFELSRPHAAPESDHAESRVVHAALSALHNEGILQQTHYDQQRFGALRHRVQSSFDIPWSAITPRMQRLVYAINAIHQPPVMIAAGIYCGYTFISNAGAAVGPGAVYHARELIGLEIDPDEAERARANLARFDVPDTAHIDTADAVAFCRDWPEAIDLLYLDADAPAPVGKDINADIAQAAWDKMPRGALLLAHNSVNSRTSMARYLSFVRDRTNARASLNVVIDAEGLEVTLK